MQSDEALRENIRSVSNALSTLSNSGSAKNKMKGKGPAQSQAATELGIKQQLLRNRQAHLQTLDGEYNQLLDQFLLNAQVFTVLLFAVCCLLSAVCLLLVQYVSYGCLIP